MWQSRASVYCVGVDVSCCSAPFLETEELEGVGHALVGSVCEGIVDVSGR